MKTKGNRINAAVIGAIVVILTGAAEASEAKKPSWWRRALCILTWEETATTYKTAREICSAVKRHVIYKSDIQDKWQSGRETWEKGTGDCEDYASAVVELCATNGVEANVIVLRSTEADEAHAVAVGSRDDKVWYSSNGHYRECDSLDEVRENVAKELSWKNEEVEFLEVEDSGGSGLPRFVRVVYVTAANGE